MIFFEGQNYLDDQETIDSLEMDRSSEAIQLSSQVEDNEEQAKIKILKSKNQWKDFLIENLRQDNERLSQDNERLRKDNERLSQDNESLRQEKYLIIKRSQTLMGHKDQTIKDQTTYIQNLKDERDYLYAKIQGFQRKSTEREFIQKKLKILEEATDPKATLIQMIKNKQQRKIQ